MLDCGEDKPDAHPEYGRSVACSPFRQRETAFLEHIARNVAEEYGVAGVDFRMVICHIPFPLRFQPPFDIETETYRKWCALLREQVKPHLMLCGHTHKIGVEVSGGERDEYGLPCPLIIGAEFDSSRRYWAGCGLILGVHSAEVCFTDSEGCVVSECEIPKK